MSVQSQEYEGIECPDQLDDPIGYHLWHEAHKCLDCRGEGYVWVSCDCDEDDEDCPHDADFVAIECESCDGTGMISPEQFDPNF